jgi:glycosyltransferase involved in cell wall biosynthesis
MIHSPSSAGLPKVLHFRQSSVLGGPEKVILDLCRLLPQHGFPCEIAIMYRRQPGEPVEHPMVAAARAQGTPIHQLDGHWESLAGAVRWLRRKFRNEELSVVHSHEYKTNLLAALAACGNSAPALVATVRHTEPGLQMALFQGLDSLVLHRFDRLTVPSQGALSELRAWPSLRRRTRVIHHSMDANRIGGPGVRSGDGSAPVVLIVGRLQAVKRHDLFLRSAREVLSARPDARFWIAREGELREKLETMTARLGLSNAVSFLGHRTDIESLMAMSDVVVCSSAYEALSRAVLEALALARPVVATAVGGLPELIRDGETGILVPPDDPQAMAAGILRLLNDGGLAQRLGSAGYAHVVKHFTSEAGNVAMLYREVLASR